MKKIKLLLNTLMFALLALTFNACSNIEYDDPLTPADNDAKVLFNEDFGTTATASPWPAVATYEGVTKGGLGGTNVTYTTEGTVTVRSNQPSSGYTGASAVNNAMLAASGASLLVNDIATCGATNLKLSFGSTVSSDTLEVFYKINGTTAWVPLNYTKDESKWGLVNNVEINLPTGTNTIKLKFVAAKTQYATRIDDILLTTTNATSTAIIDPDNGGGSFANEISIAALRAMNADPTKTAQVTLPDSIKIVGIVISDGANLNTVAANLQIVSADNSAGIMVRFGSSHNFVLGDKVEVIVSKQSLEFYSQLLQVNNVPLANATKISSGNTVTPVVANIAQIVGDMDGYESRLVKINGVTITNGSNTYSGNGTINDGSGTMTLYTRTQALFAGETLPSGAQNITAFVTRFNTTNQVCIRNLTDVVDANPNAPVLQFTSANAASVDVNASFSHTFVTQEANLTSTTVITCNNLPSWLTINGKTISGTAPATPTTYTLNIVATNGTTTATQTFTLTVKTPGTPGVNLLANGSFEDFTTDVPTAWNLGASPNNLPVEKITSGAQDGALAVKIAGDANGRCDFKQAISGIVPGTTYVISFWYKENTKTAGTSGIRLWANFTNGEAYVAPETGSSLRPNATLDAVPTWTKFEVEVTAPAGVDGFNFEIRATKSNSGIIDNCSISVKE